MNKVLFWTGVVLCPTLVAAQEATESESGAWGQFSSNYTSWDAVKVAWLFATIAIAYAVATTAFLVLLPSRNPTLAAKYGLAWGGLVFVLIHFFAFGLLLSLELNLWAVVLLALGIFTCVWVVLALGGGKK